MSRSLQHGAGKRGFLSTGGARQVGREIQSSGDRQNAILLPELSLIVMTADVIRSWFVESDGG